mmetsp:Transcript_6001/g.11357  ORF Transcript_6001/g.11357 Transcript_6001/m.11357 type:complete len:1586 (-) Transcript_6001:12-4769(-)
MDTSKNERFETPAKMALVVARNASPDSSGKEILERFRELMARRNADGILPSPPVEEMHNNISTDKSENELNGNQSFVSKELSVFKDPSGSAELDQACDEQSVMTRMKQSLAKRRTALQSRNMNLPISFQNCDGNDYGVVKKSNLKTPSHTQHQQQKNSFDGISTMIEVSNEECHTVKQRTDSNQETCNVSETEMSLELDVSIESDIVNSFEEDSSAKSADIIGKINYVSNDDHNKNVENSERHLETLPEVSENIENEEKEEGAEIVQVQNEDFEREHGELISFFEYCASINSASSSDEKDDLHHTDNLSPKMYSASDGSSLTPAASIQTFSVASALSQKSNVSSNSPPSGITPTGSVQTFSLGGRSFTINSDPLKISMFSPHFRSNNQYSSVDNEYESEPSYGGHTVIPDISIRDESHIFPSPTHRMLYASPTAKVCISPLKVSPGDSDQSLLSELQCQLEAIRSERNESNQKIALSAKHAKRIFQVCTAVQDKKANTSMSYDNATVESPLSRILAIGDSSCLSRAAATSLIERNKTLVKEVRFADQTCVELSERNLSVIRENEKLEHELKEMKAKNDKLHRDVVESSQAFARIDEQKKELEVKLIKEKYHFDEQIKATRDNLLEEKQRRENVEEKLEKSLNTASLAESKLAAIMAKYDSIKEEHNEAKETISSLQDRLTTVESTSKLAASSAAEHYREAASKMQRQIESLQDCLEEQEAALQSERSARYKAEDEVQYWRDSVHNIEMDRNSLDVKTLSKSPCKSESSKRTTSSVVLAKTLKSEVEKNHDATERIIEAEKIIALTQSKLRETEHELNIARQAASDLQLQIFSSKRLNHSVIYDDSSATSSFCHRSNAEHHLKKKLSCARSQCEEYKKELDLIIAQIKGIQSDNSYKTNTKHNLQNSTFGETVKELIGVCSKVNVVVSSRVDELEEKIQFLMNSMYQLHDMCNEEYSIASGNSINLELMEEGATPMKGDGAPLKMHTCSAQNEVASPLTFKDSPRSAKKDSSLRSKLLSLEEQLKAVIIDKVSLADALNEAKDQINLLNSELDKSKTSSERARQLEHERDVLEKSLLDLQRHAEKLECKIKNLEEDNLILFDDAAARGDELLDAQHRIEMLENDATNSLTCLKELEIEKHFIQDKLLNAESRETVLKNNSESYLELLRDAQASRDKLQEVVEVLRSEAEDHVSMIHRLQESLASANEQTSELKHSYMKCNDDLASVLESKEQLENNNFELKSKVMKLEADLSSNVQQIEIMNIELEQLQNKLESAENACDVMHEELVSMGSQVDTLHAINDEYERELTQTKKDIKGVENIATTLKTKIQALELILKEKDDELNNANSSKEGYLERITHLERQLSEQIGLYESNIRAKDAMLEQLKIQLDDLTNKLSVQEISHRQLLSKNESQIKSLTVELDNLKEKYETQLEQMSHVEDNSSSLLDEVRKEREEVAKLQRKNESLQRKCSRMREYVNNLTSKCKEWEDTYTERNNATKSLQRKYEEAMSKVIELSSQMNSSCTSVSAASIQSGFTGDLLQGKLFTKENQIVSQLKDDIQKKNMKIRSLKRQLLGKSMHDEKIAKTY